MTETLLLISDTHLGEQYPLATKHFLRFLTDRARHARELYILGDLFDYWVGDDDQTPYNRMIIQSLNALQKANTAVYFQHGNRDFLIGDAFAQQAHCTLMGETHTLDTDQGPVLLMHGDTLCQNDVEYQKFRNTVRSPEWRADMLARPLSDRHAILGEYRRMSGEHVSSKSAVMMDVSQDAVISTMRRFGTHLLIHGHTHRPAEHRFELDGRTVQRIVLGDWQEGRAAKYLSYHDKAWSLQEH